MNIPLLKAVAEDFNNAMIAQRLPLPQPHFSYQDLQDTANIVTDAFTGKRVSRVIMDQYFPLQTGRFQHTTRFKALENMLVTQTLQFSAVRKRFSQEEFKTFYRVHGMDGYETWMLEGIPLEEELTNHSFFLSMNKYPADHDTDVVLWPEFGKVKLIFELQSWQTPVRRMAYPYRADGTLPLVKTFAEIAARHGRKLVPADISYMGFFYLPSRWSDESETRALITRRTAEHFHLHTNFSPTNDEFLIVPFNSSGIGRIVPTAIEVLDAAHKTKVEDLLSTLPSFAHLPVSVWVP